MRRGRIALLVAALVAAVLTLPAQANAGVGDQPDPTISPAWTLSGSSESKKPGDVTAAEVWQCWGDAWEPEIVVDPTRTYVLYQASQQCVGSFGTQQVCVKLQQRDYYGSYYDRTTYRCSGMSTAGYVIANGTVSCGSLGHGTFRSYGRGTAGSLGKMSTSGASDSRTLC